MRHNSVSVSEVRCIIGEFVKGLTNICIERIFCVDLTSAAKEMWRACKLPIRFGFQGALARSPDCAVKRLDETGYRGIHSIYALCLLYPVKPHASQ